MCLGTSKMGKKKYEKNLSKLGPSPPLKSEIECLELSCQLTPSCQDRYFGSHAGPPAASAGAEVTGWDPSLCLSCTKLSSGCARTCSKLSERCWAGTSYLCSGEWDVEDHVLS